MVDGPFGSPSSNIYRAEHAVLVGTGIGVTPFASILQSIAFRWEELQGLLTQGTVKDRNKDQSPAESRADLMVVRNPKSCSQ